MANKLIKYFKKSLVQEANKVAKTGIPAEVNDQEAFAAGFENPADLDQLNGEIDGITPNPEAEAQAKVEMQQKIESVVGELQSLIDSTKNIQNKLAEGFLKGSGVSIKARFAPILKDFNNLIIDIQNGTLDKEIDKQAKDEKAESKAQKKAETQQPVM